MFPTVFVSFTHAFCNNDSGRKISSHMSSVHKTVPVISIYLTLSRCGQMVDWRHFYSIAQLAPPVSPRCIAPYSIGRLRVQLKHCETSSLKIGVKHMIFCLLCTYDHFRIGNTNPAMTRTIVQIPRHQKIFELCLALNLQYSSTTRVCSSSLVFNFYRRDLTGSKLLPKGSTASLRL